MRVFLPNRCMLFALIMLFSSLSHAAVYYVSVSGTSANNGTSTSTPWNFSGMITRLNNGTITAGDRILFKRGEVFNNSTTIGFGGSANSGTATNPIYFGSYGTGAKPRFQANTIGGIFWVVGKNYWTWDGLNFQDITFPVSDKLSIAPTGTGIRLGDFGGTTKSNYCVIKNCDFNNIGLGVVILGDYNLVDSCTFTNLKNVVNTPNTGGSSAYEDYGANGITLEGSNNKFLHSYYQSNWCESYDFGFSGGANEMYGACVNNVFAYNTYIDCGGIAEFGSSDGSVSSGNLFAYNKIIQCGALSWINFNNVFATQATNTKYYNNVIVETSESRFSGPNGGTGIIMPEAISHYSNDFALLAFSSGSPNTTVFDLRNNTMYISNPNYRIVSNSTVASKTIHQNNVYRFLNGAFTNFTLNPNEIITTSNIWNNQTGLTTSWDYQLSASSAANDAGQALGLFDKDFGGNPIPSIPNSGIFETAISNILTATATPGIITCNQGTTTVTVTASGGTAPYTGTGTFTVSAGTYTYTITDAAGSTNTVTLTIGEPTPIAVLISTGTITVPGGTTTVAVNASGGTGSTYTYKLNTGAFQASSTFLAVPAGTHTVQVKDANGCISTKTFTIIAPVIPPLSAAATTGTIACNGGTASVTVTATGGTPPYTGTGTFTVSAGTYTYTITDANAATSTTSVTITQPSAISMTLASGTIAVNGGTTSITVTASGGTGAYTYKLNNGIYQFANIFNNVSAGTHTVTSKDANGCTVSNNINITEPAAIPLTANATATSINCNGGSANVNVVATGGTAPYSGVGSFTVSAGNYNYTVTDATGSTAVTSITVSAPSAISVSANAAPITIIGGTTTIDVIASGGTGNFTYQVGTGTYQSATSFTGIPAGTYTITAKDANGCTKDTSITINVPINPLMITANAGVINCNGETASVTVSASGGTAPYTGTGTFTVTAGTYSYTITDANNVTQTTAVTITQPTAIIPVVTSGTITNFGGTTTITVSATGGTPAYSYRLNNGNYQAASTFNNVAAGSHTIRVRDANGCVVSSNITLSQPSFTPLSVTVSSGTINCYGATTTVTVSATGGIPPYTGIGSFNVPAGSHTYTVWDVNGDTSTQIINISQPTAIVVTAVVAGDVSGYGGTTSVTAITSGGAGNYLYSLNNGTQQSTPSFSNVPAGNHILLVTDASGCTKEISFSVNMEEPSAFSVIVIAKTDESCQDASNGTTEVLAIGGRAPYTYRIDNGRFGINTRFYNLSAGLHNVYAKDAGGNIATTVLMINAGTVNCGSGRPSGITANVFPNPAPTQFNLSLNTETREDITIEVMDINGARVFTTKGRYDKKYQFGENLKPGTYFVRITQGTKVTTRKLIKL